MSHFGEDAEAADGRSFTICSPGDGMVFQAGLDKRELGYVFAGRFLSTYNPFNGHIINVNLQLMHMIECYVKPGQKLKRGQPIGKVLGRVEDPTNRYSGRHHTHFQFTYDPVDADASLQVASGCRYLSRAQRDWSIDPQHLLYIGPGQIIKPFPGTKYLAPSDKITRRL
jgi:murein DD-endopeptidase MepM/ murein hydrolase activator NlpD